MLLNMDWRNFRSIHGEEGSRSAFEDLMYDLLCCEFPLEKVHKTDASRGGDGGIDIFVERDGGIDIYQCKFFLDKMEDTQWKQITTSFMSSMTTAEKAGVKVLKWYLCTPFISNREPIRPWKLWDIFVDKYCGRIDDSMEWLDGARIIQKLENPTLGDLRIKYFTTGESYLRNKVVVEEDSFRETRDKMESIRVAVNASPKVFISYSWSSEEYKKRVLHLATRLRHDGVDVLLDQWELKPGHDIYAFMEQSIREADKVLILCEKKYAAKADSRVGGVGAETQIITPEVYGKYRQEKFIPVIMELPVAVPSYLRGRYVVYLTKDEEKEYQDLCLAIIGMTRERKPPLPERSFEWLVGGSQSNNGLSLDRTDGINSVSPKISALNKGDKYEFGHYPKVSDDKDESLFWRVLDVDTKNGRALLITENLIDCRKYHGEWKDTTWEDCDLRKRLNGEFIDRAFDKDDLGRIAEESNLNHYNTEYGTAGGRATKDKVFALSVIEAERYFQDDLDRRAVPTPYAKRRGSYENDIFTTKDGQPTGSWWLRTIGINGYHASVVFYDGGVDTEGDYVDFDATSVRPALWLNL